MEKVVAACNSAKETPGEENAFRQLRLNQWVKQAVRWMMDNIFIRRDPAGNIKMDKEKSTEKSMDLLQRLWLSTGLSGADVKRLTVFMIRER